MAEMTKQRGRPPKSESQKAQIRKRIIDSARALFLEDGFENVSIRKIAVKAQCTPTTLYHYFHNKRHILHFLWEELFQQVSDFCLVSFPDNAEPLMQIQILMEQYQQYWLKHPDHFRVIFMVEDSTSPPGEDVNAMKIMGELEAFHVLIKAIEQGVEKGLFKYDDPELVWQILFVHSHGTVSSLITIREIPWRSHGELIKKSVETTLMGLASMKKI